MIPDSIKEIYKLTFNNKIHGWGETECVSFIYFIDNLSQIQNVMLLPCSRYK